MKSCIPRRLLAYLAVAIATAIALPAVAAGQAATSVSISASPSPAIAGQPVTLTATPSVPGTVTFSYDGQVVGTGQAVGARAASGAPARIWNTDQGNIRWMATDDLGNVYVSTYHESDCGGGKCQVKQFTPNGGLNYAPFESHNGGYIWPTGLAVDSSGNIFEAFFNGPAENTIRKRTSIGATSTLFVPASAGIQRPCGMTVDANDNLYVASSINGNIYKVTPAGVVSVYVTDYDPVTGFGPCSPVINKTTGVLYYLKYTELPGEWNQRGVVMQVPAGGGTPTQLANTKCYFGNWDGVNHVHRHSVQLTIDQTTGYLYGQNCEVGNDSTVTQISPTGTIIEYMGAWYEPGFPTGGPNAGVGQNSTWGLAVHDGFVYLGGNALGGAHLFKIATGAFGATYTFTPTAPGSFSAGAGLAPTNSGSYAGSTGSGTLVVRPAAPSAPDLAAASDLGTSDTDNTTSDNTPLIDVPGTYATGDTITVTATKSGSANVTCTYVIPATGCSLGTLADGTWSITATDTHPTGGTSAASAALSINVDTTAPSAPSGVDLAASSDTGASSTDDITSDTTPTMSAAGGQSGDIVTITATKAGSPSVSCTYTVGSATSCDLPALADGTWSVSATLTDPAGNTSGPSTPLNLDILTVGPAAPGVPSMAPTSDTGTSNSDGLTNDTTPEIVVPGATAGDTITVSATNGATTVSCTFVAAPGVSSCALPALGPGDWDITATSDAVDAAGNPAIPSAPARITVDTSNPAPGLPDLASGSDTGPSASDDITADTTPTIEVPGVKPGSTVTVVARQFGRPDVVCTFIASATVTGCDLGALGDGSWDITATSVDRAGNQSPASAPLRIIIDTAPPPAPNRPELDGTATAAGGGGLTVTPDLPKGAQPSITVTGAVAGDTITVTATNGGKVVTCTFVVGRALSCRLPVLSPGLWTIRATSTDAAGNSSKSSQSRRVRIGGTPRLSITATSSKPVMRPRERSTVTYRIRNRGTGTARNVRLVVSIPKGLALASPRATAVTAGRMLVTIGNLAPGATATRRMSLVALSSGVGTGAPVTARLTGSSLRVVSAPVLTHRVVRATGTTAGGGVAVTG